LFLYNHVLDVDMPQDINALRSKRPVLVPTVMTREETLKLIRSMHGTHQLMAKLMYGCGLRVIECIRLRVKDVDFAMNQIVVRNGKGKKDRITVLPEGAKPLLEEHLVYVKRLHQCDLAKDTAGYICRMRLPENIQALIDNGDGSMCFPQKHCR
jgi:integrase